MAGLVWQIAGSLVAVILLIALVAFLGFGRRETALDPLEACEIADHALGGFLDARVHIDASGQRALLSAPGGKLAIVAEHGARHLAIALDSSWSAHAEAGTLRLASLHESRSITLELGADARTWSERINALS